MPAGNTLHLEGEVASRVSEWLEEETDKELRTELEDLVEAGDEKTLFDAFYRTLSFGTAGLRGVMGAGTNRMNVHIVAQAMQGLADWILARADASQQPSVALCRDTRINSERFERIAAEVFAANGIHVWVFPRIEPVPTLSFALPRLGCVAGVMVTSSHNPKQYNGCKVFGADGCQISGETAEEISDAIAKVAVFGGPKRVDFDVALAEGTISWIGDELLDDFLDHIHALHVEGSISPETKFKVLYTPLNGTGLELIGRTLERVGVGDLIVVPEQAKPDGTFPTCPYPNPEFREALELGLKLADEVKPDILVATDPDADRLGTAIPHRGEYVLLTGDEVGILLMDWLARVREEAGQDLSNKVAVSSIVSSDMLDPIAAHYGFQLRRTLTGFKNIGGQISVLEGQGGADRWLMGYEESYGYLIGPYVRDKDAITATTLFVEMAGWYAQRGLDLVDAMESLYRRYGYFLNRTLNLQFPGAEGAQRMASIMASLRNEDMEQIAGERVVERLDYLTGVPLSQVGGRANDERQVLPTSDVLEWRLESGNKLMVRPSGTEPKIKCYLFSCAKTREDAVRGLDKLEAATRQMLSTE